MPECQKSPLIPFAPRDRCSLERLEPPTERFSKHPDQKQYLKICDPPDKRTRHRRSPGSSTGGALIVSCQTHFANGLRETTAGINRSYATVRRRSYRSKVVII